MRLSVPIYRLKRLAKARAREENIPLHRALDLIARKEGFNNWSLLAARASKDTPARELLAQLSPGDMVLLGARPGHGKTLMGLELITEATKQGRKGVFFTLEYTVRDAANGLHSVGVDLTTLANRFEFDDSDNICSDYIMDRLAMAPRESVIVIDYLQLLDQKRENPELTFQIKALKEFAEKCGLIIVFISQIDRSFDVSGNLSGKLFPDIEDVRLPNPLDLRLFSKTCFLNNGEARINATV